MYRMESREKTEQRITHGLNLPMTNMEMECPVVRMEKNT